MWPFQSDSKYDTGEKEEKAPASLAVQPMRVQPQPQATVVKPQPHRNDPVKTGWLASCIAALVALGLLYCSMQAVWKRAAIEAPENFCLRRVSDYKGGAHVTPNHKDQVHGTRPEEEV